MSEMAVIVPSRGRPENYLRLLQAWTDTKAQAKLIVGLDDDDETRAFYEGTWEEANNTDLVEIWTLPRAGMNGTLNQIAAMIAPDYKYIGFMGDDHLPKTPHWDRQLIGELQRPASIAYGNDLMQGVLLPTAVFMTSDIINTLGYMAPPELTHLHLDTTWKEWGQRVGRLTYRSDVIIEHLHPQAGKTDWDEGYVRVNGGEMWEHDNAVFASYCEDGELDRDVELLREIT